MLLLKNCKLTFGEYKESMSNNLLDILSIKDIFIYNEKIFKIASNISLDEIIDDIYSTFGVKLKKEMIVIHDVKENFIIPGVVDVHTHMRDPGLCYKEDFITGSKACAKGGITTFIDMPNTVPQVTTMDTLLEKKRLLNKRSYVDYAFHFGGSKLDNSSDIEKAKNITASTKIFMNPSTGDMYIDDNKILENLFYASNIISVHAEGSKVENAIKIAHKTSKPLYLCHISEESELETIKKYKELGFNIYAEVTPHHLFLNDLIRESNDLNRKTLIMKPELKSKTDNLALINGIKSGIIDTIGTDHAPHTMDDKNNKITYGIPSVESSLEMMLNLVKTKDITLYKLTELMCKNPCTIFNIPLKGQIKKGYYGDLVEINLNDVYTITNNNIISKSNWSPFNGFSTGGVVETTILRGNIIYNNNIFSNNLIGRDIFN